MRGTLGTYSAPLVSLLVLALLCVPAPSSAQPVGRGCSVFNPCGSGYSCQPGVHRCYNSPRQEGQPCSLGFSCGTGLRCVAGVHKCVKEHTGPTGVLEQTASAITGATSGRIMLTPHVSAVQQCVYNQAGYVAEVRWYKDGELTYTKLGEGAFKVDQTVAAYKVEQVTLGTRSCVGGTNNIGVVTIKGGDIARTVAIIALDIGAVGAVVGCVAGVAALTAPTGGAAVAGMVVCELVADMAVAIIASPDIIPDAKELFAVVKPPVDRNEKHLEIILYGTVFDPRTRVGTP